MIEATRVPVPSSGVTSVRGTDWRMTSWPVRPWKSTMTSARCEGPSRMSCRTTGRGSSPFPVPICTNGRPFDSAKLYDVKFDPLSNLIRYLTALTSR